jgi:hypothetical protein
MQIRTKTFGLKGRVLAEASQRNCRGLGEVVVGHRPGSPVTSRVAGGHVFTRPQAHRGQAAIAPYIQGRFDEQRR